MFINNAFAQATEALGSQSSIQGTLLQLGLIFAIFYFLLIRPQQKKIKQHEAMLNAIKKGDKIVTGGGVYATVVDVVDPMDLKVEIAEGVYIVVNRSTVREVLSDPALMPKVIEKKATKKTAANSNSKKAKK